MSSKKIYVDSRQKSIDTGETINESYVYEGQAGKVGNTFCITYDQVDEESKETVRNIIKVDNGKVIRTMKGAGESSMTFENGKVTKTDYHTPYGIIPMTFFSKNVQCLKKPGEFQIILEYILSINNQPTTETFMRIRAEL